MITVILLEMMLFEMIIMKTMPLSNLESLNNFFIYLLFYIDDKSQIKPSTFNVRHLQS